MSKAMRFLKLFVSLALLGGAFSVLDFEGLEAALEKLDSRVFLAALFIQCLSNGIMALRWHRIIREKALLPFLEHIKLYFYSTFLNTFTPANVGGDVYRYVALRGHLQRDDSVIFSLLRERFIGLLTYFLCYLCFLLGLWVFDPRTLEKPADLYQYSGFLVLLGTFLLILSPKIIEGISRFGPIRSRTRAATFFERLRDAAHFASVAEFAVLMGLSLLAFGGWVLTVWIIAANLGIRISWFHLGAIVVLVELVRLIPVSVQGIGVREGFYGWLFAVSGRSPETGFMLGMISYLALSCSLLIVGAWGWMLMYFSPPAEKVEG